MSSLVFLIERTYLQNTWFWNNTSSHKQYVFVIDAREVPFTEDGYQLSEHAKFRWENLRKEVNDLYGVAANAETHRKALEKK